ncbi:hypothetical protein E2C01_008111 [Portunus trituberculatus]|uniref:Uncharacterized protein n=1 Tax=Portunus trituberculatus TaxID=210409 RepID=A0A5B7D1X9_PORTR|nr:hypothetical protein [Portunus trituberculatus]
MAYDATKLGRRPIRSTKRNDTSIPTILTTATVVVPMSASMGYPASLRIRAVWTMKTSFPQRNRKAISITTMIIRFTIYRFRSLREGLVAFSVLSVPQFFLHAPPGGLENQGHASNVVLQCQGRVVYPSTQIDASTMIVATLRLPGGKGGFGSMLRAIDDSSSEEESSGEEVEGRLQGTTDNSTSDSNSNSSTGSNINQKATFKKESSCDWIDKQPSTLSEAERILPVSPGRVCSSHTSFVPGILHSKLGRKNTGVENSCNKTLPGETGKIISASESVEGCLSVQPQLDSFLIAKESCDNLWFWEGLPKHILSAIKAGVPDDRKSLLEGVCSQYWVSLQSKVGMSDVSSSGRAKWRVFTVVGGCLSCLMCWLLQYKSCKSDATEHQLPVDILHRCKSHLKLY